MPEVAPVMRQTFPSMFPGVMRWGLQRGGLL
jgi:hypothetical protein